MQKEVGHSYQSFLWATEPFYLWHFNRLFRELHFKWKNTVKKSFVVCLCMQLLNSAFFFVVSDSVASHQGCGVYEEDKDLDSL